MTYIPLIFREFIDPNYTTKGSELTFEELDLNFKYLGDAVNALQVSDSDSFDEYDPGFEYQGSTTYYVSYGGNIWKFISPIPKTGVTPGTDDAVWELASTGELSHQQNTDTYLAFGTADQVSANELRSLIDNIDLSAYLKGDGTSPQTTDNLKIGQGKGFSWDNGSGSIATLAVSGFAFDFAGGDSSANGVEMAFNDSQFGIGGLKAGAIEYSYLVSKWSVKYGIARTSGLATTLTFDLSNQENLSNTFTYPASSGQLALFSDIPTVSGVYMPLSGGTFTGAVTLNADASSSLQPVTLQQMNAALVGLWDDRGNYNASGNTFPSSSGSGPLGAILKGDIWTISVAGTLGGVAVNPGDTVRALVDTPGTTSSNWAIAEGNLGYTPLSNVLGVDKIFVGNPSNVATAVTPTGDWSIDNTGATVNNGLLTKVLPGLATGNLRYNGSAWEFDSTTYLTSADLDDYIRLDGTSDPTTGDVKVGSEFGLQWSSEYSYLKVNTAGEMLHSSLGDMYFVAGTGTYGFLNAEGYQLNLSLESFATGLRNQQFQDSDGTIALVDNPIQMSAPSYVVNGTAGAGYYQMASQSSAPAAVAGSLIMYSNSNNSISLVKRNVANSADIKRTLVFPDSDITVTFPTPAAGNADTVAYLGTANTFTQTNTFTVGLFGNGTNSAPSMAFSANTNSGFYNITGDISVSVNGIRRAAFGNSAFVLFDYSILLGTGTGTKIGTATNQKLGFWNATPIAQPTNATGTATNGGSGGSTVTTATTFIFGGKTYTLNQMFAALVTIGLLG